MGLARVVVGVRSLALSRVIGSCLKDRRGVAVCYGQRDVLIRSVMFGASWSVHDRGTDAGLKHCFSSHAWY